ncbi:unnamed protein product [Vicia faba]|uniref:Uncharacterized protein n=1 Tax=Vicia faba TaxID=3906 RepID=A0AAV1AE08_VICFA|nr:unnamed protein product [Vicia faba]
MPLFSHMIHSSACSAPINAFFFRLQSLFVSNPFTPPSSLLIKQWMVVVLSSQEFRPSNELRPGGRTCVTMQLAPLRSRCRGGKSVTVTLGTKILAGLSIQTSTREKGLKVGMCRFILPSKGTLNEGLIYRKQAIAMGISHVLSLRFWAP